MGRRPRAGKKVKDDVALVGYGGQPDYALDQAQRLGVVEHALADQPRQLFVGLVRVADLVVAPQRAGDYAVLDLTQERLHVGRAGAVPAARYPAVPL